MRKCTVVNCFLIHIVDTNSIDTVFRTIFTITSIKIEYFRFILPLYSAGVFVRRSIFANGR